MSMDANSKREVEVNGGVTARRLRRDGGDAERLLLGVRLSCGGRSASHAVTLDVVEEEEWR